MTGPGVGTAIDDIAALDEMRFAAGPIAVSVDQARRREDAGELLVVAVDIADSDDAFDAGPDGGRGCGGLWSGRGLLCCWRRRDSFRLWRGGRRGFHSGRVLAGLGRGGSLGRVVVGVPAGSGAAGTGCCCVGLLCGCGRAAAVSIRVVFSRGWAVVGAWGVVVVGVPAGWGAAGTGCCCVGLLCGCGRAAAVSIRVVFSRGWAVVGAWARGGGRRPGWLGGRRDWLLLCGVTLRLRARGGGFHSGRVLARLSRVGFAVDDGCGSGAGLKRRASATWVGGAADGCHSPRASWLFSGRRA